MAMVRQRVPLNGLLSTTLGFLINVWLIVDKAIYGTALFDQHGPLMLLGAVLILAGVQLVSRVKIPWCTE